MITCLPSRLGTLYLLDLDELILLAAKTYLLGIIGDIGSVLAIDALDERFLVIAWLSLAIGRGDTDALILEHASKIPIISSAVASVPYVS